MERPSIRKINGQWISTRPAYGFGKPQTRDHPSWKDALQSLGERSGTATIITEISWENRDGISVSCPHTSVSSCDKRGADGQRGRARAGASAREPAKAM